MGVDGETTPGEDFEDSRHSVDVVSAPVDVALLSLQQYYMDMLTQECYPEIIFEASRRIG